MKSYIIPHSKIITYFHTLCGYTTSLIKRKIPANNMQILDALTFGRVSRKLGRKSRKLRILVLLIPGIASPSFVFASISLSKIPFNLLGKRSCCQCSATVAGRRPIR